MDRAGQTRSARELRDLWFAIRINSSLVDWFNEVARPDDIAIATADDMDLLDRITAGRKQVVFASVAEAEALVPAWAGRVDILGYDLERWPTTPAEEQADPVAAVQRLRRLARAHGLALALRPDRRVAADYGAELAPCADLFTLQVQRLQDDPAALRDFALPLLRTLRQASPDLNIGVQLRSGVSVDQLVALTYSLQDGIDGVSILYGPEMVEAAQVFVDYLRSAKLDASMLTPSAEAETPQTLVPTADAQAEPTVTAAPLPLTTAPPMQCTWPTGLVLTGGGLFALGTHRRRKCAGPSARGWPGGLRRYPPG